MERVTIDKPPSEPAPDSSTTPLGRGTPLERRVRAEQVRHYFAVAGLGLIAEPFASALVLVVLGHDGVSRPLAVWLVVLWALICSRAILWHRYRRAMPPPADAERWHHYAVAAGAAAGLLWGLGLPVLWPIGDTERQLLFLMIVAGAGIAPSGLLSGSFAPVSGYLAAALAAVAAGLVWQSGDATYVLAAAFAVPYALLMLAVARYLSELLSDSQRLRLRLIEANEAALAASRAKSEFIANISHELRTPLNAIIGFSEIMRGEIFGPLGAERYREYAHDIHHSGRHLLAIINDILDLTKVEAGKMQVQETVVDVAEVIESALAIVRDSALRAGLTLQTSDNAPKATLSTDERILRQILLNLLSNAIKFTPVGGSVAIETSRGGAGDLLITVRDSGIGIAPEDISRVMEPFAQVADPLSRQHQGTGLGLPLVRSLSALLGADFELESQRGAGTTATVRFPAERVRLA
jgi:two-component system cell cycle sensor histidine kinase PleC